MIAEYKFDFLVLLNFARHLFQATLYLGGFYLILQRFHLRLQMRFLKNVSDEIIKINDTCIEFSFKHQQFLKATENEENSDMCNLDEKLLTELETLRSKIKNHSDYLVSLINAFPFGNPINFFYYSIKGKYLWNKTQIRVDQLLIDYQDSFLQDTILQSDMEFTSELGAQENILVDKSRIDMMVVSGIDLINYLEDHSKKLF